MGERKLNWDKEENDDLPVYLANPETADQVPRQKCGGMFCNVEGAYESKTIDFDALSVGQRGNQTPRTAKRETAQEARNPINQSSQCKESDTCYDKKYSGIEIKTTKGKEVLQNLGDEKVNSPLACMLQMSAVINCTSQYLQTVLIMVI